MYKCERCDWTGASPGTEWNIVVSATAHRHLNVSVIALRVSVEM